MRSRQGMDGLRKRREAFGAAKMRCLGAPSLRGHFRLRSSVPSNRLSNVAIYC